MASSFALEEERTLGRVVSAEIDSKGCAKVVLELDDSDEESHNGGADDGEPRSPSVEAMPAAAAFSGVVDADEEPAPPPPKAAATNGDAKKPELEKALALLKQSQEEDGKGKKSKKKKSKGRSRSRKRRRKGGDSDSSSGSEDEATRLAALMPRPDAITTAHCGMVTGGTGLGPGGVELAGVHGQVCMKFLQQECPMGDKCQFHHPRDVAESNKWVQWFNRTPCKYGNMCKSLKCLYDHPNRPGFGGGSNALVGASL
mmetsp:Transcript_35581/g.83147  ORF Transcript_35581/g.83147 Transcript_35581/m.83147 type:complete len:257 (+) Transcript_35581:98-868(+)